LKLNYQYCLSIGMSSRADVVLCDAMNSRVCLCIKGRKSDVDWFDVIAGNN